VAAFPGGAFSPATAQYLRNTHMHNLKSIAGSLALAIGVIAAGPIAAAEQDKTASAAVPSYAINKSMDPAVWSSVINQMMQGQPLINTCAACHEEQTVERYKREYGSYLQMANPSALTGMLHSTPGMMNPSVPMNPMAMANPMTMMNPAMGMMNPMAWMANPMMGMMNPMMMAPMMGMMNPMSMAPMMGMMNPMMMAPMTGMMNPMSMAPMTGMMNPMSMAPMTGMMNPMSMAPMMGMMNPMSMAPMSGMMNPGTAAPGVQMANPMMDPRQYDQWMKSWMQMMPNAGQPSQSGQK